MPWPVDARRSHSATARGRCRGSGRPEGPPSRTRVRSYGPRPPRCGPGRPSRSVRRSRGFPVPDRRADCGSSSRRGAERATALASESCAYVTFRCQATAPPGQAWRARRSAPAAADSRKARIAPMTTGTSRRPTGAPAVASRSTGSTSALSMRRGPDCCTGAGALARRAGFGRVRSPIPPAARAGRSSRRRRRGCRARGRGRRHRVDEPRATAQHVGLEPLDELTQQLGRHVGEHAPTELRDLAGDREIGVHRPSVPAVVAVPSSRGSWRSRSPGRACRARTRRSRCDVAPRRPRRAARCPCTAR